MPNLKFIFILVTVAAFSEFGYGQNTQSKDYVIRGNREYNQDDFQKAEAQYRTALSEEENSVKANYNLGNALYQQKKYDQSRAHFDKIIQNGSASNSDKASAYHNIGKSYLDEKNYEKAVENFKDALKLNPNDDETRYNYALAKKKLEEKQKEDRKNNQDSKNKNKNKSDNQNQDKDKDKNQNSDKDKQNRQDKNQKDNQQNGNNEQNKKDDQSNPNQQIQKGQDGTNEQPKSMEEMRQEDMLDALGQQERETLRKIMSQKTKGKRTKNQKDW
ncbi:MAG: tetratricopeptide repeat protein [Flavobacteriia bacterium]|nr:tetratricopeptide repeat protein [Flavobacteriia bacterium]